MSRESMEQELVSIPIIVDVPYKFAAGHYMSRFLLELRDNGKFYGVRCPVCKRVQLPPRVVCAVCHVKNDEWVKLANEGTLTAFTIMYLPVTDPTTGKPHEPPLVYGSVKLDGADSVLNHFINVEADRSKVWVGMRMRTVLRPQEQRIGDLSDIIHFEPLEGQKNPEK